MISEGALVYWSLSESPQDDVYEVVEIQGDVVRLRDLNDPTDEFTAFIWNLELAAEEDLW